MTSRPRFALLSLGFSLPLLAACMSMPDAPAPNASAAATSRSRMSVDGAFAQWLVSPQGDIDGLLLRDRTVVRLPPGSLSPSALAPGDAVRVEGDVVPGPSGRAVERAVVRKGNVLLADASVPGDPRGHKKPHDGRSPDAGQPMTASGAIVAFLVDREGRSNGLVLADGTTARVPPRAGLGEMGLNLGDAVTLTGRGGAFPAGKSMSVELVTLPNGQRRVVDTPPPAMKPVTVHGTIERALLNPHGDVDTLLLREGTVVRIRPTPASAKLAAGESVQVTGEGAGTFVHATSIASSDGSSVLSDTDGALASAPRPRLAGEDDGLHDVRDASTVARIITTARGDVDALVLADGAVVKLPPRLREDAGSALREGVSVQVEGRGNRYPQGLAFRATRVTLASGETFAEPAPPSEPVPVAR